MNAKALIDLGLLVTLWSIGIGTVLYKMGWKEGHRCGRVDERGDSASRVLNAKREGMLAERERLQKFSPSNVSKN